MENISEQIVNITKAAAFDALSKRAAQLRDHHNDLIGFLEALNDFIQNVGEVTIQQDSATHKQLVQLIKDGYKIR